MACSTNNVAVETADGTQAMVQVIPKIIHQTWKTGTLPLRWKHTIASVKRWHPDWEYRLWDDKTINAYVQKHHPDLYPIFSGFSRNIMRADVMRYILMHDIGGMYCDLDYEFIRPYDYKGSELVLGYEFDRAYGDPVDQIANFVFASAPGHPFWKDVLNDLQHNPPQAFSYLDVCGLTGPGLLSRIYRENHQHYGHVTLEPRRVFHPFRMRGKNERQILLNNGTTIGVHHASGSWRERLTLVYLKEKLRKLRIN